MKAITWCVCVLAAVLVGCSGQETKPPVAGVSARPVLTTRPANDDYLKMREVLTFTPEQRENFEAKLIIRDQGFTDWEKSDEGQKYAQAKQALADARTAGENAKITELTAQYQALLAKRTDARARLRLEFDKDALTLDQQRQWAGYMLLTKITPRLRSNNLSTEQMAKVKGICNAVAADAVNKDTYKTDPYLKLDTAAETAAMDQINKAVLNTPPAGK